jgi:hypothetical protein
MVTPPSQRLICDAFAEFSVLHPKFAGCAAAISMEINQHVHTTHAARTIVLIMILPAWVYDGLDARPPRGKFGFSG